jgi:hypothetical protein
MLQYGDVKDAVFSEENIHALHADSKVLSFEPKISGLLKLLIYTLMNPKTYFTAKISILNYG